MNYYNYSTDTVADSEWWMSEGYYYPDRSDDLVIVTMREDGNWYDDEGEMLSKGD